MSNLKVKTQLQIGKLHIEIYDTIDLSDCKKSMTWNLVNSGMEWTVIGSHSVFRKYQHLQKSYGPRYRFLLAYIRKKKDNSMQFPNQREVCQTKKPNARSSKNTKHTASDMSQ